MIILVAEKEGGFWKPIEIKYPGDKEVFAVCVPDGTIWDIIDGLDNYTKMTQEQFKEVVENG